MHTIDTIAAAITTTVAAATAVGATADYVGDKRESRKNIFHCIIQNVASM